MSCCRKRPKPTGEKNDPAPCKILEQGGANTRFWIMNTQGSYQLFLREGTGQFIEVRSFLSAYQCTSSVASMLMRNVERVVSAANKNPGVFRQQATNGISLVKLLRTADTVLSAGSSTNGRRVHPFPSR